MGPCLVSTQPKKTEIRAVDCRVQHPKSLGLHPAGFDGTEPSAVDIIDELRPEHRTHSWKLRWRNVHAVGRFNTANGRVDCWAREVNVCFFRASRAYGSFRVAAAGCST